MVNLVASIMMNGVCCLHAMHEEEEKKKDHRENLQKAMRVEWQRQRLFEKEQEQRQHVVVVAEERRRSLMAAKMKAKSSMLHEEHKDSSSNDESMTKSLPTSSSKRGGLESPSMVMAQRRVRSAPVQHHDFIHHRGRLVRTQTRHESELSSLFDDDEESLVDVALQ